MNVSDGLRWGAAAAAFSLVSLVSPVAAEPCDQGVHVSNPHCDAPPVSATPELDSVLLFGTGLFGVVSYALLRVRSRRRD